MRALLIIDMQNDFMPGGPLGVPNAKEIIPVINQLIDIFDNVYATKDWHPKNHVSFASSHNKKVGEVVKVNEHNQILWPDHCVQGTKGAEIVSEINTKKIEKIIFKGSDKNVDSYSAFFDNDHIKSTDLDSYFKKNNIDSVYMVGVATDFCVKFSAIDALNLGFNVYIVRDACMSIDHDNEKQLLLDLKAKGINIITSKDIF